MVVNGLFVTVVALGIIGHVLFQCLKVTKNLNYPSSVLQMCVTSPKCKRDNASETKDLPKRDNCNFKRDFSRFLTRMPPKVKFSKKGRKKMHRVASQSHKHCKNQQYDAAMWEKAFELRRLNETLEKGEKKWTLDAISEKTGIPKSTLGHRFNSEKTGTCKGMGHIAGGKRQARVLTHGKQAR